MKKLFFVSIFLVISFVTVSFIYFGWQKVYNKTHKLYNISTFLTNKITNTNTYNTTTKPPIFAILPHFMINQAKVDEFYKMLKNQVGSTIDHIILITPNHFGLGGGIADVFCETGNSKSKITNQRSVLCFKSWCVKVGDIREFDNDKTKNGQDKDVYQKLPFGCGISSLSDNGFFDLWTSQHAQESPFTSNKKQRVFVTPEHGLGEHFRFISTYFPDATLYPLVLGMKNMRTMQMLISYYTNILATIPGQVLVIASVDFSHYVPEDFAQIHDATAVFTLQDQQATLDDYQNLEVDCPSCLWLIVSLAKKYGQKPQLRWRDSSQSLYGSKDNTSRLFFTFLSFSGDVYPRNVTKNSNYAGKMDKKNQGVDKSGYFDFLNFFGTKHFQPGYTFFFVGDTMYDRGVAKALPTYETLLARLSGWREKIRGIDAAIANLEGPLGETQQDCRKLPKRVAFCAHRHIVDVFKEIGFDAVNIANNHIRDTGTKGFETTKRILQDAQISFFGNLGSYGRLDESYVLIGQKRGLRFAWLGYDLTVSQSHTDVYCKEISAYAMSGYIPLVSVHWGSEYETKHNAFQQEVAHMFADCGAKLIIGHHPHVVQDIERYVPCTNSKNLKNKNDCIFSDSFAVPIIYSLGNFLFDQGRSDLTKKGMYVMGILTTSGVVHLRTGEVNAYVR